MAQDFTVTITDPDRAAEWQKVLGTTTVCVTTPLPATVCLPGHPRAKAFFMDVTLLTQMQRDALIQHLSAKFNIPAADIAAEIDRDPLHAIPILDEHCTVAITNPQRWF